MAAPLRRTANATVQHLARASSSLTDTLTNLPQMYTDYVTSNSQSVSSVESTLRSLTYLLPGARFQDTEIASESVHTFVQLLSIYHDHLLKKRADLLNSSPTLLKNIPVPKLSHHARYTMFWASSTTLYTKIATVLKMTQYTELLWEMLAKRRGGERTRWRVVVFLESFKALCRLILLKLTSNRPLVTSPLPQREDIIPAPAPHTEEDESLATEELTLLDPMPFDPPSALSENGIPTPPMSESDKIPLSPTFKHKDTYTMSRTGRTLPTLPTPDTVSTYLFNHIITSDDVKPIAQLIHQLRSWSGFAGEVLYILRPLIYALLMQRVARRYGYVGTKWRKSWSPWLIGIAIEYVSRQMVKKDITSQTVRGSAGMSVLEREEMSKRGWSLAWWGMRGAFYENVTSNMIRGVADKLRGKPVLDLLGGVIEDYEALWSGYELSTATM